MSSSRVGALLEKEDFTLEELLSEEEIINECKAQNIHLLNFLRGKPQVMQLVWYIVAEPSEQADVNHDFKFPFIACEILTTEMNEIMNTLVEEQELMDLLFSFLEPYHSHSVSSAGYFSKVVSCLLSRRTVPLVNYLQAHQNVFSQLVDLIDITSIMEVLIRIVDSDDLLHLDYTDVMQYLADNVLLLDLILGKLSPDSPPQVNVNAAETLCAITRTAPSPLATKLSSPCFVSRLLSVLISLLDPTRSFHTMNKSPVPVILDTVRPMIPKLGDLAARLSMSADARTLPFNVQAKVVEFVFVLLKFNNDVAEENRILDLVLDPLTKLKYNVIGLGSWILDENMTVEVLSRFRDTQAIYPMAAICRFFSRCAHLCYEDIHVADHPSLINDWTVSKLMSKTEKVRSLHVEVLADAPPSQDEPIGWLDGAFLTDVLPENLGRSLEKLVMRNLEEINQSYLFDILPNLVTLQHLEIVNCSWSTDGILHVARTSLPKLQKLIIIAGVSSVDNYMTENRAKTIATNCRMLKWLELRGIKMEDEVVGILDAMFERKSLNIWVEKRAQQ